ncbi:MAG: hypothetical protein R2834_22930 [Rhodothermales bacterium]
MVHLHRRRRQRTGGLVRGDGLALPLRALKAAGFMRGTTAADIKANATHQVHFSIPGAGTQTLWIEARETELAATASGQDTAYRLNFNQLSSSPASRHL